MGKMLWQSSSTYLFTENYWCLFVLLYAAVLAESIWNKHEMQSANIEQVQWRANESSDNNEVYFGTRSFARWETRKRAKQVVK